MPRRASIPIRATRTTTSTSPGDGAFAIAGTPITAKAHIGHSWGNDGLGPNATSVAPTGDYWDWSLGADAT